MISYVKIIGPPLYEAIKTLESVAVDMPEVCIMNTAILQSDFTWGAGMQMSEAARTWSSSYFSDLPREITRERCSTIISKSGEKLGEYDFFFEWFREPSMDEIKMLMKAIDEALAPLGCRYMLTSKKD